VIFPKEEFHKMIFSVRFKADVRSVKVNNISGLLTSALQVRTLSIVVEQWLRELLTVRLKG
jgi:hypothetical protein